MATYYGLPDIVQGAIITAIGSSFPELSSTVISTIIHQKFELGVSVIVGSAIFNILVIPGLSGLYSINPLQSNKELVYKEAQFYMLAVATLLLTFSFAVIYNPIKGKELIGEINRFIAIIPVLLYIIYIFIQYQDSMDFESKIDASKINQKRQWIFLITSLGLILVGVEGLIRAAIGLGEYFNTPSFLWGLTVIAAGTSIADAFVSIRAAKEGKGIICLANVLGSNTFDLLIAIPIGVLIAGTATINFSRAAPLFGALVAGTLSLFLFARTDLEITKKESYILLILYIAFIIFMGLESSDLTSLIPGI
ncbi:MAG: Ca2+/Na+ antiporter [Candidatus Methanohalarchaeum thermophilum]|uniref:Ca2+/Na+ antiporter n=1 Tax=Methanohalarchaeum thermophilum TaxID=1903181 RepID=A0A1Q6DSE8_METT1|nr:MAG: Ca2+/Na+ antiporter [Candidatus Methanohalarchaeum thermophilum]